eukprot:Phypoly_transcript_21092.p1 GENE.Phypoly_transcript_21092~~Phypoly_transcript_21092.p1  ORF type:complete len:133 (-),score=14.94 Phypoly_transcript_21092:126-524(-)
MTPTLANLVVIEEFFNTNKLIKAPAVAPAVPQSIMLDVLLLTLRSLDLKSSAFCAALFFKLDAPSVTPSFTFFAESLKSLSMVDNDTADAVICAMEPCSNKSSNIPNTSPSSSSCSSRRMRRAARGCHVRSR